MDRSYMVFPRGEEPDFRLILVATAPEFPLASHPILVLATIPFKDQGNGWHNQAEGNRIGKIEDKLTEKLEAQGMIFVGHVKQPRQMFAAFYSPNSGPASIEISTGFLKKETFALESRPDPDWSYYNVNMAPGPIEVRINQDIQLHEALTRNGDNLTIPRPVDFGFLFATAEGRSNFIEESKKLGFELSSSGTWGGPDHPEEPMDEYWCELVKSTAVEPIIIAEVCVELETLAKKFGGEFDGWACPVMKD
jgi:hypothetical protein